MVSAGNDFAIKAACRSLLAQGLGIDKQPREGLALHIFVLHLVGQLTIVTLHAREVDESVLVLKHVADVAGVAQQLPAGRQQTLHLHEEGR